MVLDVAVRRVKCLLYCCTAVMYHSGPHDPTSISPIHQLQQLWCRRPPDPVPDPVLVGCLDSFFENELCSCIIVVSPLMPSCLPAPT